MSIWLFSLTLLLAVAGIPFLIAFLVIRATEAVISRPRLPADAAPRNAEFPLAIRLIFLAIGIPLSILSLKIADAFLSDGAGAFEVFQLILLTLCSIFAISFALPQRHFIRISLGLLLAINVLNLCSYLWRLGGYWRWGIVVLLVGLTYLMTKAMRNRRKAKEATNNAELDSMGFETFSAGDGGDSA